ncbi:MAG: ABC transporter permease [Planctomycetota bacterium]
MRKTIVVAVREYQAAVRTKTFIVMLVAMPLLMGGSIIGSTLTEGKVDTKDKHIAVIDRSGILFDRLQAAAEQRNKIEIRDGQSGKQTQPKYIITRIDLGEADPPPRQLAERCDQIRTGRLFALVVVGPDIQKVEQGRTAGTVEVYSEAGAFDEFKRWLERQTNAVVRELRFAAAGLPKEEIDQASTPVPVESRKLLSIDAATGQVSGGARKSEEAAFLVPFFVVMLMFMVVNIGAGPLINSVLEEKMQRIAEVLLSSVGPFELMAGKLLGMVGVSLTILTVYLAGGVLGARVAGFGEFIPANLSVLLVWFVVFQALAVLLFGAMFIAVGAACSDLKEAQSLIMPIYIFIAFPMFVLIPVIREPTSTLSVVLSLIPPATPMLMTMRLAAQPNLPLWQPLVGVGLVLLTTAICVFAAGRIFRVGLLIQGKGARFSDMIKWAVRG